MYPTSAQHMGPNYRPHGPNRRQSDYYAQQMPLPSHPYQYPVYHQHPSQYHVPPQMQYYQPQWYQPYPQYAPHNPRHFQPHSPMSISNPQSHIAAAIPATHSLAQNPQMPKVPHHELPQTPSTASQAVTSPSTTPTTTSVSTSTPPAVTPKPTSSMLASASSAVSTPPPTTALPSQRMPYYPKLPWFSVSESSFPDRVSRRRRRKPAGSTLEQLQLPLRPQAQTVLDDSTSLVSSRTDVSQSHIPLSADALAHQKSRVEEVSESFLSPFPMKDDEAQEQSDAPETCSTLHPSSAPSSGKIATRAIVPAVPILPPTRSSKPIADPIIATTTQHITRTAQPLSIEAGLTLGASLPLEELNHVSSASEHAPSSPSPAKAPPKSWAELFARGHGLIGSVGSSSTKSAQSTAGPATHKVESLGTALHSFEVASREKLCFIEPRGLVNTGNMCYMNSVLQVLLFCTPFYDLLDQVGSRVVHSFQSRTPLVEAMIMFMREYPVIDSSESQEQLRLRLKDKELEQYGDPFIPEHVYEVIKSLPRFSSMRRGHQQDAEEFLGFLLEGLHDECSLVMKGVALGGNSINGGHEETIQTLKDNPSTSPAVDSGWLEVGPKQKAAITRSSGMVATDSPITKIFGGKLRSVLRVPGLKDSVTLEPYQPLQLDIGAPNVYNITDALKGLTRLETLHGEFNSPRGPGMTATKQVFIDTLPPVLILHLKRFQYDNAGGTQKIWRKVGYPLDLEIPKEAFPQHQRASLSIRPGGLPKYRLISVVYHHGKSASGGHYTVDVRRQEGLEWIRIDDTVIRRIRAEDVAGEGTEEDPKLLVKALEQHKRDDGLASDSFYMDTSGDDDKDNGDGADGGWSQVNGAATGNPGVTSSLGRNWSAVANAAQSTTPTTATSGLQTPKAPSRSSVKDNKVAYILFYQRVES